MHRFKDQARLDYATFFNVYEFASKVKIDGVEYDAVVDQDYINAKSNLQIDYFDGVFKNKQTIYLRYSDIGYLPAHGQVIDIDDMRYEVVSSSVAHGVVMINVGVNDG